MRKPLDYSLYLVTDSRMLGGRSMLDVVRAAVAGGVRVVQLREKQATTRAFYQQAKALHTLLQSLGIPLIINDRLDIMLAVDAEGLHIGQQDLPCAEARRLLGSSKYLGLSVENEAQAHAANALDVDYIGLSPVFSTPTKTDIPTALGLQGVAQICKISHHPTVGIGGIHAPQVPAILSAGAQGIAVVSAIMAAPDPQYAAQHLRNTIDDSQTLFSIK